MISANWLMARLFSVTLMVFVSLSPFFLVEIIFANAGRQTFLLHYHPLVVDVAILNLIVSGCAFLILALVWLVERQWRRVLALVIAGTTVVLVALGWQSHLIAKSEEEARKYMMQAVTSSSLVSMAATEDDREVLERLTNECDQMELEQSASVPSHGKYDFIVSCTDKQISIGLTMPIAGEPWVTASEKRN